MICSTPLYREAISLCTRWRPLPPGGSKRPPSTKRVEGSLEPEECRDPADERGACHGPGGPVGTAERERRGRGFRSEGTEGGRCFGLREDADVTGQVVTELQKGSLTQSLTFVGGRMV